MSFCIGFFLLNLIDIPPKIVNKNNLPKPSNNFPKAPPKLPPNLPQIQVVLKGSCGKI